MSVNHPKHEIEKFFKLKPTFLFRPVLKVDDVEGELVGSYLVLGDILGTAGEYAENTHERAPLMDHHNTPLQPLQPGAILTIDSVRARPTRSTKVM